MPVLEKQVATRCVGVDRPVQVASTIKVVGQAEGRVVAQIVLECEVRLLRIRIHKILCLRVTKGLERQRKERCRLQVVLIDEQERIGGRISGEWVGIKPLPTGLVTWDGGQAARGSQNTLEYVGRVQTARIRCHIRIARRTAGKKQLAALRSIRRVA